MKKLPLAFIYARLLLGLAALGLSLANLTHFGSWAVAILIAGLLSDIFDGIIARKLNVSSPKLRRLDSNVDQIFFLSMAAAVMIHCPTFLPDHWIPIGALLGLEMLCYVVSFYRFGKEVATHSLGAKFWTLTLVSALTEILLHCQSDYLFSFCIAMGLLTRLEILAILFILKDWAHDIPTFYHAIQIRKGKPLSRNGLFNG